MPITAGYYAFGTGHNLSAWESNHNLRLNP